MELKAPLGKGLALTVGLWDTYGRLVQTAAPDGAGRFGFEKIKCPLSRTYKILAQVKDNGTVVEDSEAWVGLPSSAIDDFQFVMWADGFNQRKSKTTMHQCKQYGVTGYYDLTTWVGEDLTRESADNLARNNLVANPYCYGLYGFCVAEKMDYPKFQCGKLQETTRNLTENVYPPKVNAYKRYGAMAYSICEENFIDKGDIQWDNPEAMRDYHAYLRGRYGDIGKLNAVWGSSFKDFDGIGKISFMEAKVGGKFTQWFEQERHKIDRFNGVHEQVCGKIRELDPGARFRSIASKAWISTGQG